MNGRFSRRTWLATGSLLAIACLLAGFLVDRRMSAAQLRTASEKLQLLMTLRKGALESYFDTVRAELTFWSINDTLQTQLLSLREGWAAVHGDPMERLQRTYIQENPMPLEQRRELASVEDGSAYDAAHFAIHELALAFVVERGYYDFFLIMAGAFIGIILIYELRGQETWAPLWHPIINKYESAATETQTAGST